jgi:hypothetical protein
MGVTDQEIGILTAQHISMSKDHQCREEYPQQVKIMVPMTMGFLCTTQGTELRAEERITRKAKGYTAKFISPHVMQLSLFGIKSVFRKDYSCAQ